MKKYLPLLCLPLALSVAAQRVVIIESGRDRKECKEIDQEIREIDEETRKPQTIYSMNYYREKRRELMDRRFRECR